MVLTWLIKGVFYKSFFIIYKNEWECLFNLLQKNRDVILNRAKYYYENDKERWREQARDKYRKLSEEEKNKKREYGKNRYRNMSDNKKKRLKEYQKNLRRQKSLNMIIIMNKIIFLIYNI